MAIYTRTEVVGGPTTWWTFLSATIFSVSSSEVVLLANDGSRIVLSGTGITGSTGGLTGGTITSYARTDTAGATLYETITGFSVLATEAQAAFAARSDLETLGRLLLSGNDTFNGSSGADTFKGFSGNDTFVGGDGLDTAADIGAHNSGPMKVTLSAVSTIEPDTANGAPATGQNSIGVDTLISIEKVIGTGQGDTFTADASFTGSFGTLNVFEGRGGNDIITGNGNTRISFEGASAAVTVNLVAGSAQSTAGGDAANVGVDVIVGGVVGIIGSNFGDTIQGDQSANIFNGRGGNDTINGGGGADTVVYSGQRANYSIVFNSATGTYTVTDMRSGSPDGTDTLVNVAGASFQFNNATFTAADLFAPSRINTVVASGDQNIDALLGGTRWAGSTITYNFPLAASQYPANAQYFMNLNAAVQAFDMNGTFAVASTALQTGVRLALLQQFAAVAPVTFFEVAQGAPQNFSNDRGYELNGSDISVGMADLSPNDFPAHTFAPANGARGGDAWFQIGQFANADVIGSRGYANVLHQMGHALGLRHGHDTDGPFEIALSPDRDSIEFSVMTYREFVGGPAERSHDVADGNWYQSLMMLDIQALQYLYGADFTTNAGSTTYTFSTTTGEMFINGIGQGVPGANRIFITIWDGNGTDTYDFSNYTANLNVDLTPGGWSVLSQSQQALIDVSTQTYARGNVFNALQYNGDIRSLIENAVGGSGNDSIRGNDAANVLRGNGGNDTLDGGAGSDTVVYSGNRSAYSVSFDSATGEFTIADIRAGSPDGTDVVRNVELFSFNGSIVTAAELAIPPNRPPTVSGPVILGASSEDTFRVITTAELLLNASDPDGQTLTVSGLAVSRGTLFNNQNGTWRFTPELNDDTEVTFTYLVSDGIASPVAASAILDLIPAGDPAVIGGTLTGSVTEDGALTASGVLTIFDPDIGEQSFQPATYAGDYGSAVLSAAGAWTYTLNNALNAVQALNAGQTLTDRVTIRAFDGTSQVITITVNGANEVPTNLPPIADADGPYAATEDATLVVTAANGVLEGDVDPESAPLTAELVATTTNGTLTLNDDGSFSYQPNANFNGVDSFVYRARDNGGLTSSNITVQITVAAINDPAVITGQTTGAVTEDAVPSTVSGTISATDIDSSAIFQAVINGATTNGYGTFSLTSAGAWSYALDNANATVNALSSGQTLTDTFTVLTADGTSQLVTVTINGATEAPVNTAPVFTSTPPASIPENTTLVSVLAATDSDAGQILTYAIAGGENADLFEIRNGNELHFVTAPDYENLPSAGTTLGYQVTVQVSDGNGGTATQAISVGVTDAFENTPGDLTPVPLGSDLRVNTTTTSNQTYSSVTALSDGGFVVTWASDGQDGDGWGIYGQLYAADGTAVGGEFQINTYAISDQFYSSVAALVDGGFVVTWTSQGQDGDNYGVYGQRYAADSSAVGSEFQVNTYTESRQRYSSVASLSDGGFVVTWESSGQDGSSYGIYGQRYAADGEAIGSEFQVNTHAANLQTVSSVASLPDGGFVVVWTSNNQDGDGYGIYGQRYAANGAVVEGEFQVNTYTSSDQFYASATSLSDGGFVVTWSSLEQDPFSWGIYGQRYAADGSAVGGEFQINTHTPNDQHYSSVVSLRDGGFVVTWSSSGQDDNGSNNFFTSGIYGQRYDANGEAVGSEFRLNSITAGDQFNETYLNGEPLATLADGRLVATWTGDSELSGNGEVYVRLIEVPTAANANTAPVAGNGTVDTNEDTAITFDPRAFASDPDGDALIVTDIEVLQGGVATLNADGTVTYTPAADSNGLDILRYTVSDGRGGLTSALVDITVTPVNDPAVISGQTSGTVTEDAVPNTVSGTISATDIDSSAIFQAVTNGATTDGYGTFSLTSAGVWTYALDNANATVNALSNGQTLTDTFTALTADGTSQPVTVTINGANEVPVNTAPVFISTPPASIPENTTLVSVLAAADPDAGQTLTYSIANGSDAELFEIRNGNELHFKTARDFESPGSADGDNVYDVTVRVSDGAGGEVEQAIAVHVGNLVEPTRPNAGGPYMITQGQPLTLDAAGTVPDTGVSIVSYEWLLDGSSFATGPTPTISWSTLSALNAGAHTFTLRVLDSRGQITTDTESILLTGFNPTITSNGGGATASVSVAENTTSVATVAAFDPNGDAVTYSIVGGADAGWFQIDASTGVLSFVTAPNFEVPADAGGNNVYDVTVEASDGFGGADTQAIAVGVTNANEAPTAVADSIGNIPAGFVVNPGNGHFYRYVTSQLTWDQAATAASSAGGYLATITSAQENAFVKSLLSSTFAFNWLGGNDRTTEGTWQWTQGPEVGTTFWVGVQNGSAVAGRYTNWLANEPNQAGGEEDFLSMLFSGQWNDWGAQPGSAAPYIIEIGGRAQDGSLTEDAAVNINVLANDTDPDAGDMLTVAAHDATSALGAAIGPGPNGTLRYDPTTSPQMQALAGGQIVTDTFAYTVRDAGELTSSATVTVRLVGLNDAPTVGEIADQSAAAGSAYSFTLPAGTFADVDAGDTLTLTATLAGGAALPSWLQFNAATGTFSGSPQVGDIGTYQVLVTATDALGASVADTFSLAIDDPTPVNTPPELGPATSTATVAENTTLVRVLTATDPDAGQTLTYTIVAGSDAELFEVRNGNELHFKTARDFESPDSADGDNVYDVTVRVSDGAGGEGEQTIAVEVIDVDETAPTVVSITAQSPSITNAASIDFLVTFSEAVTGVDVHQFRIAATGGISLAEVLAVTPIVGSNGTQYAVTVSTGSGDGNLVLLVDGAGIRDANGNALGHGGFLAPMSIPVGAGPASITVGDIDSDGNIDLITSNVNSLHVSILRGNGDGTFQRTDVLAGPIPVGATVADVNGDGKADLVYSNREVGSVTVRMGNGEGTFAAGESYAVGRGTNSNVISVADLNNDGMVDISVANSQSDTVSILLNNGDGTFQAGVEYQVGFAPVDVANPDLNGDGIPDLVTSNQFGTVGIRLGNGDGSFGALTTVALRDNSRPLDLDTADVDGDGIVDIVVALDNRNTLAVLRGNGDGTFGPPVEHATGERPLGLVLADVDGDGDKDAVVTEYSAATASVLLNDGTGNFGAPITVLTNAGGPYDVAAADVNGDGQIDLLVANADGNTVSVIVNAFLPHSATISVDKSPPVISGPVVLGPLLEDTGRLVTTAQLLANASDAGGRALQLLNLTASSGTLTDNGDGSWSFQPDADDDTGVTFTYGVSDGIALPVATSSTLDLLPVNDAPTVVSAIGDQSVTEGAAFSFVVPAGTFADVDAGDTRTLSASGLPSWLSFDAASGTFSGTPGFDTAGSYDITVTATDEGELSVSDTFTLNVGEGAPTNTSPVFTSTPPASISENTTLVGVLAAADPDAGQTLTYSIAGGEDAGLFEIRNGNELHFKSAPDFEYPAPSHLPPDNVYNVVVQVSDGAGGLDTQTVTVNVHDVNEAPRLLSASVGPNLLTNGSFESGGFGWMVANGAEIIFSYPGDAPNRQSDGSYFANFNGRGRDAGGTLSQTFTTEPGKTYVLTFDAGATAGPGVQLNNVLRVQILDAGAPILDTTIVDDTPSAARERGIYSPYEFTFVATSAQTTIRFVDETTGDLQSVDLQLDRIAVREMGFTVTENTTTVGQMTAEDPDAGPTLTYSIASGVDAALFQINATTGELSFVTAPNYEAPADADGDNVYDVVVQVSDGTLTDTQAIAVTVFDTNEAPAIAELIPSQTTSEGAAFAYTIPASTFSDSDIGDSLSLSASGMPSWLQFDAVSGTFAGTPGFMDAGSYEINVTATDIGGLVAGTTFIITVADAINLPPVITSNGGVTTAALSIAENSVFVTDVNATDANTGQLIVYSISGGADAAKFQIDPTSGVLTFIEPPNFETRTDVGGNNVYNVTVRASDGQLSDDQALAITVTNVNEAPTALADAFSVNEDRTLTRTASNGVRANDTDPDTPRTSLVVTLVSSTTNGDLTLNADGSFAYVPNANFFGEDTFRYTVSDGEFVSEPTTATITVTPVNDAPVITSNGGGSSASIAVPEGFVSMVATVTAADAEGTPIVYSISGGADAASFTLDAATGVLTFVTPPDFEARADVGRNNTYNVTVRASDGTLFDDQSLAITVTNVNEAPTAVADTFSLNEDQTLTRTASNGVRANDTDPDTARNSLTATLVSGTTHGVLTFNADGSFAYRPNANFFGTDSFTYTISDGEFVSAPTTVTIAVAAVNDAPVITSNGGGSSASIAVPEGFASTVATITGIDAEGTPLVYSISGGADAARFTIDAATGVLTFVTPPDFDAPADSGRNNVYNVTVRASDGALFDDQSLAITVTNINEAPAAIADAFVVNEDRTLTRTAGNGVRANDTDPDTPRANLVVQLVSSTTHGSLTLNPDGSFTYVPNANFHGEDSFSYSVTDGEFVSAPTVATISVASVNDVPVITSNGGATWSITVPENTTNAIATITATDTDGDSLSYQIVGGADAARFVLDPVSGALRFAVSPDFEAPEDQGSNNSYTVVVEVTDGAGGTDRQTVNVRVTDVADNAPILGTSGADVNLRGTNGADVINALGGNDVVRGQNGDDVFVASVNDGNDQYDGGAGIDTYSLAETSASATIVLTDTGGFAMSSQIGIDTLLSIENIIGGSGDDTIQGNASANRLEGGVGNDVLTGDDESDTFVFKPGFGNDRITDFDANPSGGQDYLELSGFGITAASFASRVSIADVGADTLVTIDGDASQTIHLTGIGNATTITIDDFKFS